MAELKLTTVLVVRTLADGSAHLAEPLLFPEVSCLAGKSAKLPAALERHIREIVTAGPPGEVYRRRAPAGQRIVEVRVELRPPRPAGGPGDADAGAGPSAVPPEAWRTPIELLFHAVVWRHGEQAHVAAVPALGIEVVAGTAEELEARLPQHARFALSRTRAATSLRRLVYLQRTAEVRLSPLDVRAEVKSPKQLAAEAGKAPGPQKPAIEEVGTVLSDHPPEPAWELDAVVTLAADALAGRHARSVLLVGRSGVGKTAATRELVRRRADLGLGHTPFWSTGGARLVAGMSGFGMWQERCRRLVAEASKARAVLCLGNLIELIDVGKSTHNAQGIASFLRPYLSRGEVVAVCECTPEQLVLVERADPHLLEVFHTVKVEEPGPEVVRAILEHVVQAERRPGEPPPLDAGAMAAVDRLHRRYATYSALPARPIRFVRNLLRDRHAAVPQSAGRHRPPPPPALGRGDVIAAFARETGLPLFLLDEAAPLDLAEARRWFASRLIGQEAAVDVVADLLAAVKAALSRPGRPIASLLLIGPTGVGKTELAKLLAEFFFSDRGQLTRFDMSEYGTPEAVERLVGGGMLHGGGSPGECGEGLLTARVREQPFSVVLLDEFEKAHPALFDLMLQVLGEGRLTDAAGRVADFSNAVVLMTSNLGAASFQQGPFGLAAAAKADTRGADAHFLEEVRDFFRPELFNRIDRVVPFAPLGEGQVLAIAGRELELIRRRDGVLLRGMELCVSDRAVGHLARRGFDARYGARPLKRAVERDLLVPLAEAVNDYAEGTRVVAEVDSDEQGRLRIAVRAAVGAAGQVLVATASGAPLAQTARDLADLRRDLQRLRQGAAVLSLQNDLFTLRNLRESIQTRRRTLQRLGGRDVGKAALRRLLVRPDEEARLERLKRLEPVAEAMESFAAGVTEAEDRALLSVYDPREEATPALKADLSGRVGRARDDWRQLLLALYALRYADPDRILVVVYGDRAETLFRLAAAYRAAAASIGGRTEVHQLLRPGSADPDRVAVREPDAFFAAPPAATVGIALRMTGPNAAARFEPEAGLHVLAKDKQPVSRCLVDASPGGLAGYEVRFGVPLREALARGERRRTYHLDQSYADNGPAGARLPWSGRDWESVVAPAIEQTLWWNCLAVAQGGGG